MDLNDSSGLGYGTLVGSTQRVLTGNLNGSYSFAWTANNKDDGVTAVTCSGATCTAPGPPPATINLETPWTGFGSVGGARLVLVDGTGAYAAASIAPGNSYFEVGIRQP